MQVSGEGDIAHVNCSRSVTMGCIYRDLNDKRAKQWSYTSILYEEINISKILESNEKNLRKKSSVYL